MSLLFTRVTPARNTAGLVDRLDIPLSSFLTTAFEQGQHDSAAASFANILDYKAASSENGLFGLSTLRGGRQLSPEEANEMARAASVQLSWDRPVYEGEVNLLIKRKQKENYRSLVLSQGATNPGRYVGMIGTSFFGSVANPIDFSLMFVPIVGSGSKVSAAGKTTATAGRLSRILERGLVPAKSLPAPRLTGAIIEGSVGNALAEIPLAISERQSQANYGTSEFLTSIAAGGVLAGGFRLAIDGAFRLLSKASAKTRDQMMQRAIDQMAKDEPVEVDHFIEIDMDVLRQRAAFDEAEARSRAKERVPGIDKITALLREEFTVDPQPPTKSIAEYIGAIARFGDESGVIRQEGQQIVVETSRRIYELGNIDDLRTATPESLNVSVSSPEVKIDADGTIVVRGERYKNLYSDPRQAITMDASGQRVVRLDTVSENPQPRVFRDQAAEEIAYQLDLYLRRNPDEPVTPLAPEPLNAPFLSISEEQLAARAKEYYESAVTRFIDKERQLHDPEVKLRELVRTDIAAQQAQGRVFKAEPPQSTTPPPQRVADESIRMDEEITVLEQEIRGIDPEAEELTATQQLLKQRQETGRVQIEAAVNCIIGNG